jgi:hypothetical protein
MFPTVSVQGEKVKLACHKTDVVISALRRLQAKRRPRVAWIAVKIGSEHAFRPSSVAVHQQCCPKRFPDRKEPVGRFSAFQCVLYGDSLLELSHGTGIVLV